MHSDCQRVSFDREIKHQNLNLAPNGRLYQRGRIWREKAKALTPISGLNPGGEGLAPRCRMCRRETDQLPAKIEQNWPTSFGSTKESLPAMWPFGETTRPAGTKTVPIAWSGDFVRRAARKARDVDHVLAQRRNAVRHCEPRASLPGVERQQGKAGDTPAATALPSPNPRRCPSKGRRGIGRTRRRTVQSKYHSPRQGRAIHR